MILDKPQSAILAEEIAEDNQVDKNDGRTIMQICDLFYRQLPNGWTGRTDSLTLYIHERLADYDRIFGWNWPGKNQNVEDMVYGLYARMYVATLGHDWWHTDSQEDHQ